MSHQPERKEKNCLNCGTTVIGRYCHVCGQENIETRETFWSLTKHFVFDILHFDGKFWHTLKYLIIRPGLVARQYCQGKRNSYLHPIRMYLFTSAVFFLLFFAIKGNQLQIKDALSKRERIELTDSLKRELVSKPGDTAILRKLYLLKDSTRNVYITDIDSTKRLSFFMANNGRYSSLEQYDSVQKSLPREEKHGWLMRTFTKRGLELREQYGSDMTQGVNIIWADFLHKVPYMLFLSLPFFALILKLLYVRRKNFFYSDHAIFTLYHYIASFILLMAMMAVGQLSEWTGFSGGGWLIFFLVLVWMAYLFMEMKSFYKQGWFKTFAKFLVLDFFGFFVVLVLFFVFLVLSFLV